MRCLAALLLLSAGVAGAAGAAEPPPGAAACSGCHSPNPAIASPGPRLNGMAAEKIVAAFGEYRAGTRPATVMDRIARGFADDEVRAMAAWFAAQQ